MKRILLLNANRVGIGTYHRALNFGRALARAGHVAEMITVSETEAFTVSEKTDTSGLRIIEGPNWLNGLLPWHASGPLDIALRLGRALKGNWDVVYAFEYQPNVSIPVYIGRPFSRFRLVSDWCDWHAGASYYFGGHAWAHRIDGFFEEAIRKAAHHLTVINRVLYDRALNIGIPTERISLIREGVDTSYMRPLDRSEARERLGLPQNAPLVGAIKDTAEGHAVLLDAFARLLSRVPEARLLMIGNLPERVPTAARSLGVFASCHFPGRVTDDDLPWYLAAADLLVLPLEDSLANRGRWPHKLGDMIACERPVVTSAGGEFPTLLGERACAALSGFHGEGIAAAALRILESPKEAMEMAARGRRFAQAELDWSVIGKQVVDVVEGVA